MGARYYDPRTSVWQSPDPILGEYMSGQTNGGVFNPKNLGLFSYTYNNPVNLVDPDGRSTWINDKGDVTKVNTQDNDFSIYQHVPDGHYGPPNKVGETHFIDSFKSPDSGQARGKIFLGKSIEGKIKSLHQDAKRETKGSLALKSTPGGKYDIKKPDKNSPMYSYNGYLFKGKYVSVRDAGNILAGMNAKEQGVSFEDFQKAAGALHQEGLWGLASNKLFGKTYGEAPKWGENNYQYFKSKYGYNLDAHSLKGD